MRINGQTDLTKFLRMSINNPEFIYYVQNAKWEARRRVESGVLTSEYYENYIKEINDKIKGKPVRPTINAWLAYDKLATDDGMVEFISSEVLSEILNARETCAAFIRMVDSPKFQYGEKALHDYMISSIQHMSEAIKENSEDFWDHYTRLKHYALWGVAKGSIRREYMSSISRAIGLVIKNELQIIKQSVIDEFTLKKPKSLMSQFDDADDSLVIEYVSILDNLPEYVETWLVKSSYDTLSLSSRDVGILDKAFLDGRISGELHSRIKSILYAHSNDLASWTKASDYSPIMFLRECLDGVSNLAGMSLYTRKEMGSAYQYAKAFADHYTNKSIIENVLEGALEKDFMLLGNVRQVEEYHRDLYFKALNILSNHGILTLQQTIEYERRGRDKFGAL